MSTTTTTDLDALLKQCRKIAEDLAFEPVKRWKQEHPQGKVFGHFQVYFPEELPHAGGMLPLKVVGGGNKLEARSADAHLGSFICSIMRSSLELGLSGRLGFLDAMVTLPICDAARHIAGIWTRTLPAHPAQILYLPQNPNAKAALDYLTAEYGRMKADIERLLGQAITPEALQNSIAVYNENRRLLRQLYDIRRRSPWLISAVELCCVVKAGTVLTPEAHNDLLREILPLLPQRDAKPQDKVRVVFAGAFCELPPLEMLQVIEELCYIVDDDYLIGSRWLTEDVPLEGDPLENLARAYIQKSSWAPTQYDARKPKETMLEQQVKVANAQGAICAAAKFCEPGLDDQLAYAKHFDRLDVPYILVEFEEKQTSHERLHMQVETFAESVLFD